ncbi:hypothetical protein SprV_0401486300 [Sparganum proliferum]
METEHSSPGGMFCADAGVEVPKDNQSWSSEEGLETDDGGGSSSPTRQTKVNQTIVDALRQARQSSHDVFPDAKGDARVLSLCLGVIAPEEGVAGTHLLQLALLGEPGPTKCSDVHLVAREFSRH